MKTCNKFFAELFGTFVLVFGGWNSAGLGNTGVFAANGYGPDFAAAAGDGYLKVGVGVALFSDCATWSACGQLWLFIVAPLVGACLAGLAYKCIMGDCCCKKCEK